MSGYRLTCRFTMLRAIPKHSRIPQYGIKFQDPGRLHHGVWYTILSHTCAQHDLGSHGELSGRYLRGDCRQSMTVALPVRILTWTGITMTLPGT
nr:hypothetical protein CFP56_62496 [Quercus suber]